MTSVSPRSMSLNIFFDNTTLIKRRRTPIVSDEAMFFVHIYMNFILCGIFSVFGIVNNVLNMITFHNLGLKDSMSVGLMALSLTDFLVCFLSATRIVYFVWNMAIPDSEVNPLALSSVTVGWWRDVLFLCSSWVTTFLSIERCVCVVFPFKVKAIFTRFRSIVILAVIYTVHVAIHMPVFLTQWLEWTTIETTTHNETTFKRRLVIRYAQNRRQIQLYIDIANGTVLPVPSQILVLISALWMIYGLKASSKIRKSNSTAKENAQNKKENNLTAKERKLVKVVLFLAVILTLCNIPRFLAVYAKQIFPAVALHSADENMYMLLWNIPVLAGSINSSINIVVYLTINTNYRQKFSELFCKKIT